MKVRRLPLVSIMAASALAATAPASMGHTPPGGLTTARAMRAHARQDAEVERVQARALRRWRALSPAARTKARSQAREQESRLRARLRRGVRPAEEVGRWTTPPFTLPNFAVHAAMLPTGKVIFWGAPPIPVEGPRLNRGEAALWDPEKPPDRAFKEVPPPLIDVDGDGTREPTPIYCAGLSFLPSGALLVSGGNGAWPNNDPDDEFTGPPGLNSLLSFDPFSKTWIPQPAMNHGRWYPSQVELADGRTVIYGGYTEEAPGAVIGGDVEVFTPAAAPWGVGSLSLMESAERPSTLYPHLFTLPDGSVLLAGPDPFATAKLDTGGFTWDESIPEQQSRGGGTAVLRPGADGAPDAVTEIGGYPYVPGSVTDARQSTETLDLNAPDEGWKESEPLTVARSYHNTVLLPDGTLLTVGGGSGFSAKEGNFAVSEQARQRRVELLAPGADGWRRGPAQLEDRSYHSTALLLPDGRVFSAGDDLHPLQPDGAPSLNDTAEIYSPPYLFRGDRPRIRDWPEEIFYGQHAEVEVRGDAESAVLVAPSATTHAVDMQQRLVPLEVTAADPTDTAPQSGTESLTLTVPAGGEIAPPGYYMLFVLDADGVPSKAQWVHLT